MEGMRLGRGNAIGYKEDSSSFNRVKLWWKENDRWRGGSLGRRKEDRGGDWVEGRRMGGEEKVGWRGGGWVEGMRLSHKVKIVKG